MANSVRLEIDFLEILRKRSRWNLYFIFVTEDPTDPSKSVVTTVPSEPIKVRKMDKQRIDFEAEGNGETNGLIVFNRALPADNSVTARLWVVQSRDNLRKVGDVMDEISTKIGGSTGPVTDVVSKALGAASPWLSVAKGLMSVVGVVGEMLEESKDRKMGFVSLDEHFSASDIKLGELDRSNTVSSFGELGWTYTID